MMNLKTVSITCAKTLLIILNGCCILIALCTFVFAVVDTGVLTQYGEEYAAGTFIGDIVVILASWLVLSVATFGAAGAIRNSVKILYLYIGFIMITMIVELLVIIYVVVQRYGLEFTVSEWLREDFFRNITGDELKVHSELWDKLQTTYECCGLNGPEDYHAMRQQVSMTCCPKAYRAKTDYAQKMLYRSCLEASSYFSGGCEDEILDVLRSDAEWLQGVAITSLWFEVAGMLLSMWLVNNAKYSVQIYKQTIRC